MKAAGMIYVKGSAEAVAFYQKAFNLTLNPDMIDRLDDGVNYGHASLMSGETEIIAVSEDIFDLHNDEIVGGKLPMMTFGVWELGSREAVDHAYAVLSEGARINGSKGPGVPHWDEEGEQYAFGLVDKFGVHWNVMK